MNTVCKHAIIYKENFLSRCSPDMCGRNNIDGPKQSEAMTSNQADGSF